MEHVCFIYSRSLTIELEKTSNLEAINLADVTNVDSLEETEAHNKVCCSSANAFAPSFFFFLCDTGKEEEGKFKQSDSTKWI